MTRALGLLSLGVLAACGEPCPASFGPGDIVRHRLAGWEGIVLREPSKYQNLDGVCLVNVRSNTSEMRSGHYSIYELEAKP